MKVLSFLNNSLVLLSELEQATEQLNSTEWRQQNRSSGRIDLRATVQIKKLLKKIDWKVLGELELQGEELSGSNSSLDRNKLSKDLITAQRSEEKLVEELCLIENKLREAERTRERLRAEMENSSGAKGMAGGAAAVISARDNGELTGIIGDTVEIRCAPIDLSHESALSTAIGGGTTSIVVENDEIAAKAIGGWPKKEPEEPYSYH